MSWGCFIEALIRVILKWRKGYLKARLEGIGSELEMRRGSRM
jgi:hypothetical protein